MRIELPDRRAPVTGSASEIGWAIAEMVTASGPEGAIDGRTKVDVAIGEIRGTVPHRPLAWAPGGAAGDILFDSAGP